MKGFFYLSHSVLWFLMAYQVVFAQDKPLVQVLDFQTSHFEHLVGAKYEGDILFGYRWRDAKGENIAIFTRTKDETFLGDQPEDDVIGDSATTAWLHAYHYVCLEDGKCELVREVKDFEKRCQFDLLVEFIEHSVYISDWDQDGIGELTFMYRLACRSDLSPATVKLIMLEGGEKYAIRGYSFNVGKADYQAIPPEGESKVDPTFEDAPPALLEFAKRHWELFVVEH